MVASAGTKKSQAWDAAWGSLGVTMDGTGKPQSSPLLPYKRGMPLIKYLGLPLEFVDEEATQFADKGRFLKCILLTIGEILAKFLASFRCKIKTLNSKCLLSRSGVGV